MTTQTHDDPTTRVSTVHDGTLVVDAMAGAAFDFEALLAGGVTGANVTLASSTPRTAIPVMKAALRYHALADAFPDKVRIVELAGDLRAAKDAGQVGVVLGVQGCTFLEEDLDMVEVFYHLGLRIAQITYSERNALGSGCLEPVDFGLTKFGRQVVHECNRLGIVVDLSHVGERTALDAVSYGSKPSIVSHGNARALNDNPRCITDALIKAVAQSGGVVGVSTYSSFAETTPNEWPSIADVVKHLLYIVELVGIDHVGLGTDTFEGSTDLSFRLDIQRKYGETLRPYSRLETRMVQGLPSLRHLRRLTAALLGAGLSDQDVAKILGGNFMRIFDAVW
jgi:membrane dipeptidase